MSRRSAGVCAAALYTAALSALSTGCASALMKLPADPGVPSPEAAEILTRVTSTCRAIKTFTAEVGVSGKLGGQGIRRGRLLVGLASPSSAYLDAPAPFGASVFIFAAAGEEVTLLLPRDRRVLRQGRPSEVLEAAAGVPLSPAELLETVTGCAPALATPTGTQIGDEWRIVRGASEWYLRRARAMDPWRLVAVVHKEPGRPEWRAEFKEFVDDLPHAVRIASVNPAGFDLTLRVSQIEVNVPLEAATFHPRVPADYAPLSLEDLRRAGPVSEAK